MKHCFVSFKIYPYNKKKADLIRAVMYTHTSAVKIIEKQTFDYEPYVEVWGGFDKKEKMLKAKEEIERRFYNGSNKSQT